MAYAKARPGWGPLALCGLLLAGCTGGGGGDDAREGRPSRGDVVVAAPDPAVSPVPAPKPADPEAQPGTPEEARKLIARVIAGPGEFPAEVREAAPYESDPRTWSVLRGDCVWNREPLPGDVLATLTRHFEIPPAAGRGRVRLSATVTVHRAAADAAWEQARMVEESLHCDEQVLRGGERLTGLVSQPARLGEGANLYSEDSLGETGTCVSDQHGGPYPYSWQQVTYGSMVASASVCGGRGYGMEELMKIMVKAVPTMQLRAREEIGRDTGTKDGVPGSGPGASAPTPSAPAPTASKGGR
ncbi:hypothetical protein [Streptomyces sp. NPDC058953]|uniref:hypothetical protein n=1 Tax=unclassified Streptomyces TaxID=2593676 RepID=UPI003694B218